LTRLNQTAGGGEEAISGTSPYSVGQWIHLAVAMNDGGTNASTLKVYKNGTLFYTSSSNLSPPIEKIRTQQFIGRSSSIQKYFQGDLDDLRMYTVELSAGEIASLHGEASSGTHYQSQALNNPTGFSVSGLPTGLALNPTTGEITGHSTAVGDHNLTLSASNLSGTSPIQSVLLTVVPEKPLFETRSFEPSQINGLKLWLDATDSSTLSASSNTVTQWSDQSGNGQHLTASGDPQTGTRSLNTKNVVDFDGSGDYFESSSAYASGNNFSILMVAGIDAIDHVNDSLFSIRQTVDHPSFQMQTTGTSEYKFNFVTTGMGTSNTFSTTARHGPSIYELVFNDATDLLEAFIDGTSLGTTPYTAPPHQGNKLVVFANRGRNAFPDGFVAEMISTTSAHSTANRQNLEGYLAHKWGLSANLPALHPHKQDFTKITKVVVHSVGANSDTVRPTLHDMGGAAPILEIFY